MKKIIFTVIVLFSFLFEGCNDKLDIQKDYDFEVVHLPYKSSGIELDEDVEIRFEIRNTVGNYLGTTYYLRYFQFSGSGFLVSEDSEVFLPNDEYELENKKFRLYFTPYSMGSHNLVLTFLDSWGHEKEVELTFEMNDSVQDTSNTMN